MLNVFLDALKDSAIVLAIVFGVYLILAFFESKFSGKMLKAGRWAPVIGAAIGLIPQCGFSVVAADMYSKRKITAGTVLAVFVATSDEALPIFLSNPDKILMVLPLLGIKLVVGIGFGYLLDLILRKAPDEWHPLPPSEHEHHEDHHQHEHEDEHGEQREELPLDTDDQTVSLDENEKDEHVHDEHHDEDDEDAHVGCCHHHIEGEEHTKKGKVKQYLLHPLVHSLKIFAYVFVVNMIFQTILYYVGEDKVLDFLQSSRYAAPAIAVLVGLIPNCASSVMLSELYMIGGLGFGACVGGLCVNAGLGLMVLYRHVKSIKQNAVITAALLFTGLTVGYVVSLIMGF